MLAPYNFKREDIIVFYVFLQVPPHGFSFSEFYSYSHIFIFPYELYYQLFKPYKIFAVIFIGIVLH